ncbi:hypothetical protein Acsp01_71600 [Actinoplanes sp. NBRC 101535]|nr:hypothetical protein Acsp01_71600 [Actinoplanes sp. NBRC 101535]
MPEEEKEEEEAGSSGITAVDSLAGVSVTASGVATTGDVKTEVASASSSEEEAEGAAGEDATEESAAGDAAAGEAADVAATAAMTAAGSGVGASADSVVAGVVDDLGLKAAAGADFALSWRPHTSQPAIAPMTSPATKERNDAIWGLRTGEEDALR